MAAILHLLSPTYDDLPSNSYEDAFGCPPQVSAINRYPRYSQNQIQALDWIYQLRAESLLSYDDLVGNLINTLTDTNQLSNTYVIFTSDNGYHFGQFRLASGKTVRRASQAQQPTGLRLGSN